MKKSIFVAAGLMGAAFLVVMRFGANGSVTSPSRPVHDGETKMIFSALYTEPNFENDVRDAKAIVRGTVLAIDTAPEQVLNHNTRVTISVDSNIKGDEKEKTIDVYALGGGGTAIVDDNEKLGIAVGESGIFVLDWMPQAHGFYTFFGGPRGILVEKGGHVRDWKNASVTTDELEKSIKAELSVPDQRPKEETLGDMIRDATQ